MIINSILDLAKKLDIVTVLEGVETEEEAAILSQFGGQVSMQGYYFGKPMTIQEFETSFLQKKPAKKKA